jgi:hypothetical protein
MTYGALNNAIVGSHTREEFDELVATWGWRCYFCGIPVRECVKSAPDQLTEEHLIPLSRGGVDFIWNVVPACLHCNQLKGVLTAEEFQLARPGLVQRQAQESTGVPLKETHPTFAQQAAAYLDPKLAMDRPRDYYEKRREFLRKQASEIRRLQLVDAGQMTLPIFGDGTARKLCDTEAATLPFQGMDLERRKA